MTIKYGFFNSIDGDRKYNADDIGRYLQGIVSSGVYADASSSLQVFSDIGMDVRVQPGRAMLDYHYMENTEPLLLTINSPGVLDRIDAVVMRLDLNNRLCEIAIKQGTPATSPQVPTMTRTDVVKEYMLASVYVGKLAAAIRQKDITDTRGNSSVCGWVHGLIEQVDTATLWAQYQAGYEAAAASLNAYVQTMQQEFDAWFAALVNELDIRTYIQEYRNMVVLTSATNTVTIGIEDYVPLEDVLIVNVGGLIWATDGYTVSGTGATATLKFTTTLKAGDQVEFRVLKSKIGSATAASTTVLALEATDGSVLTDGGAALTL